MIKKLFGRQQGFTLLELLIVIVIIGILATIVVPGLVSGPRRARDAQRKADLRAIKNALETYYNDNNAYISSTAAKTSDNTGAAATSDALVALVSSYIPSIPCDPSTTPKSTTVITTDCTANTGGTPEFLYKYRSTATTGYRLCASLENAADTEDGTGNSQDGYSTVTGVNGTAPTDCVT